MSNVARKLALLSAAAVGLVGAAHAQVEVFSDTFEFQSSPQFGPLLGWLPNGSWANHAEFFKPGYNASIMGQRFGYYTPRTEGDGSPFFTESTGTLLFPESFEPNTTYKFSLYGNGGLNPNTGFIPLEIGYLFDGGTFGEAQALAVREHAVTNTWGGPLEVTYTTPADGPMVNKIIRIYLPPRRGATVYSDVWFDAVKVTKEPAITTGVISGDITLDGWAGAPEPIYVYILPSGAQLNLQRNEWGNMFYGTPPSQREPDFYLTYPGALAMPVNHRGTYDIVVDGRLWLRKRFNNVNLTNSGFNLGAITLAGGDINEDNTTNLDDFLILASNYETDPLADIRCDLTGDGLCNLDDFLVLAASYELVGD